MLTAQALPSSLADVRFDFSQQPQSATEIRLNVSALVAESRISEANTLSERALQAQPQSEELLVIRALVCEVTHQWHEAADCLNRLLKLQGREAPAETWYQYVRVLQCLGMVKEATETCKSALGWHPQHSGLLLEHQSLSKECGGT